MHCQSIVAPRAAIAVLLTRIELQTILILLQREKTSQAFRDALQFQYRSSNAFKQQQRAASKPKLQRKLSESVLDCRPSKKDTKCKRSVSDPGTDGSTDFLFQFKDFEDYASVTPSASDASVQNQIWPHVTKSFTKSAGVVAMETNEKQTQPELSRSACFVQPNDRDGGGALQAILQPQPVCPRSIQPNIAAIPSLFQQKDLADPVVPVAPTSASIQQTSAALPLVYERLTGCPAGTELATQVDTNDASLFEMLFKITEGDQSAVASAEDPYEPAPIKEASSRD